jgi:hypothetical protein
MTATTLRDNRPARALVRRLGFRARTSSAREIEFELQLQPTSKQGAASDVKSSLRQANSSLGLEPSSQPITTRTAYTQTTQSTPPHDS